MIFQIDNIYTSSSTNSTPGCADWNYSDNVICYGSANSILIYDNTVVNHPRIVQSLKGHHSRVNVVKWISKNDKLCQEIVSGSNDNKVIVWGFENGIYVPLTILNGHINAVTSVDATYDNNDSLFIVSASADSKIKIWKRTSASDGFDLIQTVDLLNSLCLTLRIIKIPNGELLLACALDNCKVHLFTYNEGQFVKITVVTGHEDWVRGLDFVVDDHENVLLATSSQDTYIRIWSLSRHIDKVQPGTHRELEMEKTLINIGDEVWACSLEAVLSGHEGWVYSVRWHPPVSDECGKVSQPMKLLSASLDKTMTIWQLESETDSSINVQRPVWVECVRVGEVGGNGLGFYGGLFGPNGHSILGHGYTGSFHIWNYVQELNSWQPAVVCGGHHKEVVDIGWEPKDGLYLVSVSTDQSTRIHALWKENNDALITWHEIARPQVHGYDMSALAVISKYKLVSGAEEKLIRAFEAPHFFLKNLMNISKEGVNKDFSEMEVLPYGASVPSLGLSNKAVYEINENARNLNKKYDPQEQCFIPTLSTEPPTEETLMQNTLWPEIKKLYGHGYEIYALAASQDGSLVASACKATTQQHASIILWDTKSWIQLQTLSSHQLTVTQLEFSPDNTKLLSVSRDRKFSVFEKDNNEFALVASSDKTNGIHSRIIWCCAWTHDSRFFTTGSRDGKVVAWAENIKGNDAKTSLGAYASVAVLEIPSASVTALAFCPICIDGYTYLTAIGFENGGISLYKFTPANNTSAKFELISAIDKSYSHDQTVRRLKFRPTAGAPDDKSASKTVQLASCGNDHAVKIFNITFRF